ncbi:conserved hypothetical protein [Vibrio coralliirubri]|uniref:hypothetical protein n=1 Tax=Vibrio coralliirubri TaxID=1516159 RepID=UPI00063043A9|nr:hypothetical protein [Vibrio coralliirubri]CDT53668.1 conserved hypothetical protein [Vibrio coralliirubri]
MHSEKLFDQVSTMLGSLSILEPEDVSDVEALLLDEEGQLKVLPMDVLAEIPRSKLRIFCHKHAFYSIPSLELINFISSFLPEDKSRAMEIGAGNGVYGRSLGIRMVDNYQQHPKNNHKYATAALYGLAHQPTVNYGKDVVEIDANKAFKNFKPKVVVASWVTHKYMESSHERGGNMFGVDYKKMIRAGVKTFVLVGNLSVHQNSPLMDLDPQIFTSPAIFSRASRPELDRVFVWNF